jgi:hypothetical protein
MLLALGCSAPPGSEDVDGPPEFAGAIPSAGNMAPGAIPPANALPSSPTGAGGSGSEAVGAGLGLQPAPAPSQNAGQNQNQGAGGSAMVPPPAPNTGVGGSSMAAGGAGMAAGGAGMAAGGAGMGPVNPPPSGQPPAQQPPPAQPPPAQPPPAQPPPAQPPPAQPPPAQPPSATADCGTAFFCDDFETVAAGTSPAAALWEIIDSYSVVEQSANVLVSSDNARSGGQALRVLAASRAGVRGTLPQTRYFVRAWLQIDSAPEGPVFIGLGTDQNSEARLRIQGESFATINTVGPGDKVHPDAANSGVCGDCVTLTPNTWFCAEMFIDNATQNATLWIDGVEAASKINGDGGWPVQPANPSLFLGSMAVQGGSTGVWIDDVAAGPERLGCN